MDRHGLNILTCMAADRFDPVFVEPASASRDALGRRTRPSWGVRGRPWGDGLAFDVGMTLALEPPGA
jgi:hypothetical protein